jgi:hypothetical protein
MYKQVIIYEYALQEKKKSNVHKLHQTKSGRELVHGK